MWRIQSQKSRYLVLIYFLFAIFFIYLVIPASFNGPGFSVKHSRFTWIKQMKILEYPLDESGEILFKGINYQLQITYINYVREADPINITEKLISYLEDNGIVSERSNTVLEKINDYDFYTTELIFSDGVDSLYLIYSINFNSDNESLYYFICSSTVNTPRDVMQKYLNTFNVKQTIIN